MWHYPQQHYRRNSHCVRRFVHVYGVVMMHNILLAILCAQHPKHCFGRTCIRLRVERKLFTRDTCCRQRQAAANSSSPPLRCILFPIDRLTLSSIQTHANTSATTTTKQIYSDACNIRYVMIMIVSACPFWVRLCTVHVSTHVVSSTIVRSVSFCS